MSFASALSQHPTAADATAEVIGHALERQTDAPDLAVVFCSPHHVDAFADVVGTVRSLLKPRHLIGAAASGIVGGNQEIEDGPAVSLWTGTLGSDPEPVRLSAVRTEAGTTLQGLPKASEPSVGGADPTSEPGAAEAGQRTLVLLCDPFSLPVADVLDVLAARDMRIRTIGGLASASFSPGGNLLALDDEVFTDGAVGVILSSVRAIPLVSQGCRPIGAPMVVTKSDGDQLIELAGQPALARLQQVARQADSGDRALLSKGVHLGVAADEHRDAFDRGDFLVRNVVGADREAGSLSVGTPLEIGTTVQFQVRDAASADEDLRMMLAKHGDAEAALVFTCNGRGQRLFGTAHHDAELVAGATDGTVAGMFCAGEIGPVGQRSFLHGFTASVLMFPRAG